MNLRRAADQLEAIRNDRHTEAAVLLARVDSIGSWLAEQKTSRLLMSLLREAHELSSRFDIGINQGRSP